MRRAVSCTVLLLAAGCASARQTAENVVREARAEINPGPTATARLVGAQGQVVGTATLREEEDGVDMELHLTGVPAGVHGIHIHQVGTCTPPGFESAGGHFNPTARQHGFENPQGPHAGDLRNIEVSAGGAHLKLENQGVRLSPGANSLMDADGSALVIHAAPDDYRTDPSGSSGARIACGVITGG